MSKENFEEEKIITQRDVENKQLKEENEKSRKENEKLRKENEKREIINKKREMTNENEQLKKNIVKDANIKKLIEERKEVKSPNWIDKNEFEKILVVIDSNKFNYKNKTDEFKYIDIKDLVNDIKNNTISETSAKKDLNTLNKIKNAEIIKIKSAPLDIKNY